MRLLVLLAGCIFISSTFAQRCKHPGDRLRDARRCDAFFVCETGGRKTRMLCPKAPVGSPLSKGEDRLRFNAAKKVCDWPGNVDCNGKTTPTKKTRTTKKVTTTTKKPRPITTPKPVIDDIPKKQKVCFKAKGQSPGTFRVRPGHITSIKITHQRGRVTCDLNTRGTYSYFGCSKLFDGYLAMVIVDNKNKVIFPPRDIVKVNKWGFYMWEDENGDYYKPTDKRLTFNFDKPVKVHRDAEEYTLWYGEDFLGLSEASDNDGEVCTRVEVHYK
eukprot:TCONS_00017670-protein